VNDLKYQLHGIEELKAVNLGLSRSEWEKRHNFVENASVESAHELVTNVSIQYEKHKRKTRRCINTNTLQLKGD
jgi:hypothetical protein